MNVLISGCLVIGSIGAPLAACTNSSYFSNVLPAIICKSDNLITPLYLAFFLTNLRATNNFTDFLGVLNLFT